MQKMMRLKDSVNYDQALPKGAAIIDMTTAMRIYDNEYALTAEKKHIAAVNFSGTILMNGMVDTAIQKLLIMSQKFAVSHLLGTTDEIEYKTMFVSKLNTFEYEFARRPAIVHAILINNYYNDSAKLNTANVYGPATIIGTFAVVVNTLSSSIGNTPRDTWEVLPTDELGNIQKLNPLKFYKTDSPHSVGHKQYRKFSNNPLNPAMAEAILKAA